MQRQEAVGHLGADMVALVREAGRQPQGLSRALVGVDIHLATALVREHEPDKPGPHDEPDHQHPPVELGVHRREV